MERKDGEMTVMFDTYENVKKQVYDRIVENIDGGGADDINFDVAVDALDYTDGLAEDMMCGFLNEEIYKMVLLSGRDENFRSIFSRTAALPTNDIGGDEPYSVLMTVWTLLYREVLVENYIGLRDIWRKRMENVD